VDDEQIFRKHRDDLIRYAAVLVGPTEGEDVVSTVVLRVLVRRRLEDLDDARAYLFRSVLNESKTRLSRSRTQPSDNVELTESSVDESRPEVFDAVMGLPAQQRAATYLVYWAGMSTLEAAELMGVRPGTVRRYLHLARRTLKGVLDAN
jgi:RNA polymerase sigma-70 factor (ECF subfamily)